MEIDVSVISGSGNIFSVIDNRQYNFSFDKLSTLAPYLCSNSYSKGKTEGFLVIDNPPLNYGVDFTVHFFNPDGSSGMMCGNGGRCAVFFAAENRIITKGLQKIHFLLANQNYTAFINGETISIEFPPPFVFKPDISLRIDEITIKGDFIDVGSPHFIVFFDDFPVLFKNDFSNFDVTFWGSKIRNHTFFKPDGTNVDFVNYQSGLILLRTYERGVENETGACGTGALSVGYDAFLHKKLVFPIRIIPTSGEELQVEAKFEEGVMKKLILTGTATVLEKKKIKI